MIGTKPTGRYYFRRNFFGFLILYVEVEEFRHGTAPNVKYFKPANEEDLIGWTLNPSFPLLKE